MTTDQQARAAALQVAATLCSGNLTLEEWLDDEVTSIVLSKVLTVAQPFLEYITEGTWNGTHVEMER